LIGLEIEGTLLMGEFRNNVDPILAELEIVGGAREIFLTLTRLEIDEAENL
jgi:hypothetical protein